MSVPTDSPSLASRLAARCAADGEFRLAARYWTGGLVIDLASQPLSLRLEDGIVSAGPSPESGVIRLSGRADVWEKVLARVPPPFFNDILPARAFGLEIASDPELLWQYYPAVRRAVDLLREEVNHAPV